MTTLLQNITLYTKHLLDLIFPPACLICRSLSNDPVCTKCKSALKHFKGRKAVIAQGREIAPFDKVICLFPYEAKFERKQNLLPWLNQILLQQIKENQIDLNAIDIITAVPLAQKRFKERGFNQAALLAKNIGDDLNIPYQKTILRTKETLPQFKLKREERIKNLDRAFQIITPALVKDKKILLVDDIYTTGTTLGECGKVLAVAGTKQITGLTLAKAI
ncbi:MAG: ComF family protein [Candidatus Saganbacteria bacterium]|nr:ComF family protein [Candidatus Saganbacteria bacterium]